MNPKALYIIVALSIAASGTSGKNLRGSKDNYYTTYYYSSKEEMSNLPAVTEAAHSAEKLVESSGLRSPPLTTTLLETETIQATYYYSPDDEKINPLELPEAAQGTIQANIPSEPASTIQNEEGGFTQGTISSDEEVYEYDEEVALTVSVNSKTSDYSGWRVGIFMREANPQGGSLPPIISLPLCPETGCVVDSEGSVNTPIVFGMSTLDMYQWPMDLYTYGTGFDAYVLDGQGRDVLGPARFIIQNC